MATPIGNLADLTLRAIETLARVDAVACEDTRVTGRLLAWIGVDKPLLALHAHNEAAASAAVLGRLERGERVACVSDAGTPGISDPGAGLVARVAGAGVRVVPLPGASSVVAALSVAGDTAASGFEFHGFVAARGAQRETTLATIALAPASQVVFESPHRIAALAAALAAHCPARRVTVARELTKQFEEIATLPAAALPRWLATRGEDGAVEGPGRGRERGEFVLVLHAAAATPPDEGSVDAATQAMLDALLDVLPLSVAVRLTARLTQTPRNAVYAAALARGGREPGPASDGGEPGEKAR